VYSRKKSRLINILSLALILSLILISPFNPFVLSLGEKNSLFIPVVLSAVLLFVILSQKHRRKTLYMVAIPSFALVALLYVLDVNLGYVMSLFICLTITNVVFGILFDEHSVLTTDDRSIPSESEITVSKSEENEK